MSVLEQATTPDGYKKTEYGIFPSDWRVLTLGDVCSFIGGAQPEKRVFSYKEQAGYIRLIQIRDYKSDKDIVYIPEKLARKKCSSTDIMIGRYGPPIFQILRGIEGAYNVALIKATPKDNIEREFLYYFLKNDSLFELMDMLSQRSSGQTGVELPALKSYPIGLPPKPEQTAIANALSDVDALLAELEKLIAKKQAIKTATMQQLLTGKTRLPQFSTYTEGEKKGQPKGTKSSELGEIPEDWDLVRLEDVITFKNGAAHEDCIDEYGNFVLVNSKFISTEGKVRKGTNECRQATIQNDLLMVMSDVPNGKAIAKCFLVDQDNLYTVNQRICILRPNEQINPTFLLKIVSRNPYYLSFDDGAKQTNLRREDVLNCPLVNPSFEEQTAIASIISDMDSEIQTLELRLAKTRQIKQGMMQELLTGRTRLPFEKES